MGFAQGDAARHAALLPGPYGPDARGAGLLTRPLRIAIDATAIPKQMAGAGVYTYQLVRALAGVADEHELFVFARGGLFDDLTSDRFHVVRTGLPSRAARLAWEQTRLPFHLRRLQIDVLHSPHHHTPAVAPGIPRVVTFHDVTFMLIPDRYPAARRLYMQAVTRVAARVADAIVTPSETVRRDVVRKLGVDEGRVVAVHEAPGPQYRPVDDGTLDRVREAYGLPQRYVLSVGSLEPGKNRHRLIRAFARACPDGWPLVIVGQPAWNYEGERELVGQLGLQDRVRFLGYVPDDELPALYTEATIFAFPSLYEGFGLPVLEAMACGAPVLTSDVSATAEVAGDAALLVSAADEGAIEDGLRRLASDDALRAELRARGFERAAQFSWERAARETLALYERVAAR